MDVPWQVPLTAPSGDWFGDAGKGLACHGHVRGVNPAAIHRAGDAVGEHRRAGGFLPQFRPAKPDATCCRAPGLF